MLASREETYIPEEIRILKDAALALVESLR